MSSKRRNELAQVRKEEFDALDATAGETPGRFERASTDVLAKRRMISVSDRFAPAKPSSGLLAGPKNPFAAVVLKPTDSGQGRVATPAAPQSEARAKLVRCNKAFLEWLERQRSSALAAPWTDGVLDYIRYAEPLAAQVAKENRAPAPPPPLFFGNKAAPDKAVPPTTPFGPPAQQPQEDEDAMPLEAPAKLIRADDGDETQLIEVRCLIRRLDRRDSNPTWRDLGKGLLRVMKHIQTSAKRVVVRNDTGKVVLNFALGASMKFFQDAKGGLKFTAVVEDGPQNYYLRTKPPLEQRHLAPAIFVQATGE